ncbi:arginase family protein [Agrobacterium rosae]|uniref:arginase family protein n=1 Tax=Agrobacterium rosae TaxID=1972867 RepID=UPI00122F171B|nr:arginase family protein [Agrobacterium rosae]KAA3507626.1 arginase family protein [Agrobacterium rosae]KAA3512508.1 arginase family protein [Agrobacterium rosae]MQB51205.1 arginase family protein [Agrobacterium rosae]
MAIDPTKTLRLNLPQWQGGDHPGYQVGARVLAAIAPDPRGPVETVAVANPRDDNRSVDHGIKSRPALLDNLNAARAAIAPHDPEAIVTLGGDCLVNLAPTAHLSERYGDELAVIWIDAHPDVMTAEEFNHAHAHVLAILMGIGDEEFVAAVPRPVTGDRVLYVGLTETTPYETDFISRNGMTRLSPEDLDGSVQPVLDWLRRSGATKVAVHFDLDVLDPSLYDYLLFNDPSSRPGAFDGVAKGRMRFEDVAAILHAVDAETDIVGLAIAEYLPWSVIKLSDSLRTLPLFRG